MEPLAGLLAVLSGLPALCEGCESEAKICFFNLLDFFDTFVSGLPWQRLGKVCSPCWTAVASGKYASDVKQFHSASVACGISLAPGGCNLRPNTSKHER